MRLVYQLVNELKNDPSIVPEAQAMTLDTSRPNIGCKATYGLYGSEEWWENIKSGRMPGQYECGVITELFHAGQDGDEDDINSFMFLTEDGTERMESIYCDDESDYALFRVGCTVKMFSVLQPLKSEERYASRSEPANFVIEMAVSEGPVAL